MIWNMKHFFLAAGILSAGLLFTGGNPAMAREKLPEAPLVAVYVQVKPGTVCPTRYSKANREWHCVLFFESSEEATKEFRIRAAYANYLLPVTIMTVPEYGINGYKVEFIDTGRGHVAYVNVRGNLVDVFSTGKVVSPSVVVNLAVQSVIENSN